MNLVLELSPEEVEVLIVDVKKNLATHRGRKGCYKPEAAQSSINWRDRGQMSEIDKQRIRDEYAVEYQKALDGEAIAIRLLEKLGARKPK
jgi:hypothetical protein